MTRREFSTALAGGFAPAAAQQARPNMIVVVADDMGFGDLGANGAADARTPHMDRLAGSGIRFTDWHSNSPVCSPSRASILTGQYPQHCGVPQILPSPPTFDHPGLRAGQRTLATELKAAGYRTAAIGKWHLGSAPHSRPMAQGFDEFFGFYSGWTDFYSHTYYQLGVPSMTSDSAIMHDMWRNEREVFEQPVYQTELLGREARSFLSRQTTAQPFLLYLAFGAPHYPMMAPQQYLDRFPASMDRDRRVHLAMVAAIDDVLGSLAGDLQQRGLTNTVVFFQSDNGATRETRADHRGRPYRGGSNGRYRSYKGSLFEGGHRVSSWMRWPGRIRPGQVIDQPLMAMDLMPTLLNWSGRAVPAGVDGVDASSVLLDGKPAPDRTLYWDYAGQRAARRGNWKLIEKPNEGLGTKQLDETWLVDLKEDPEEKINRATAAPEKLAEMKAALAQWPPWDASR